MIATNYVHRYWTGDKPKPASSVIAGRIAGNFAEVIDWDDLSLPGDINLLVDEHSNDVPPEQLTRHTSNIVRYALLQQFGGIWLDHDFILMSTPDRGQPWIASSNGFMVGAAMGFPRSGDPHLALALESLTAADTSYLASGGGMLEKIWTDVQKIPLPYSYEGVRDLRARPWGIHLWGSKS